jgi:dihydrodipicolinate synthase/N-acetylneuraminate lyase
MLLSGEDSNAYEFTLLGGDGVISVTSNVAPERQVGRLRLNTRGGERGWGG